MKRILLCLSVLLCMFALPVGISAEEALYMLDWADLLTEEEETYYKNEAYDFCSDLEPEQFEALGITEQVLYETMRQIAVANKYQNIVCDVEGVAYEDYNFDGALYLTMKEAHEIVIHEDIWDRVDVGGVTLDNY